MTQLLLIDDHQLFTEGLKNMFSDEDGIRLVAHTTNGQQAPSLLAKHPIDLVLMDIDMPHTDGLQTMDLIKQAGFDVPILMLTMHQSVRYIRKAMEKGACGYIIKAASRKDLMEAIQTVSQRKQYFHAKITNQLFDYLKDRSKAKTLSNVLSGRELDVVKCLAQGMNSRVIGETLFISQQTVRTHRRNIMHKLHVRTSAELIHLAMEKGWVN